MIDYSSEGTILPIEQDGVKGYASINAELCHEEDGLDFTGNYFVYLLHPKKESTHFILEPMAGPIRPWKKVGGAIWIEPEIVQQIIDEIKVWKK